MVPKGLLIFLGFFYAMWSLIPVGNVRNNPDTYSLGLFTGLFSDVMVYCLPIVSCEMTKTK